MFQIVMLATGDRAVGHPVNVAFFSRDYGGHVSPLVWCAYGGESLVQDLRVALDQCGIPGVAEVCRELFLHWVAKYDKTNVCMFNLATPGISAGAPPTEIFQASLAHVRELIRNSDEYVGVDLDEFVFEVRGGSSSFERGSAEA